MSSQITLNEIEIEYRVEHQAKFLLKTQQAPALRWFSSQDGLEKLLEKAEISAEPKGDHRRYDLNDLSSCPAGPLVTLEENGNSSRDVQRASCPSITEACSVPEINVLEICKRNQPNGASVLSQPSTSTDTRCSTAERHNSNEVNGFLNTSSTCCGSSSLETGDISSSFLNSAEDSSVSLRSQSITPIDEIAGCVVTGQVAVQPKCEPTLLNYTEDVDKLPGSTTMDNYDQGPGPVRSAPILPSERTIFRTDDNIVLLVEGQKICVSKVVLSLHSEFFKAMFATDMKESQQSEIGEKPVSDSSLTINFSSYSVFSKQCNCSK